MCIILSGIPHVSIMVYQSCILILWSSAVHVVQISPKLSSFPDGLATLSQARYHNNDCGKCHLSSLLDCKLDSLPCGVLEYSELWFDKTGTVLLISDNPVLYSMPMKSFREHLRDVLFCKKREEPEHKKLNLMRARPPTGQPEELWSFNKT